MATTVHAAPIISSQPTNPGATHETRGGGSAILTVLDVGASDVQISQFGTFGDLTTVGNIKFVIFDDIIGNAPLFSTAAIANDGSGGFQWYDSPLLNFNLLANSTYQLGLISDQSFTYTWDIPGVVVAMNGLIIDTGENGNANSFANPVTIGNGSVVNSFRAFGAQAVPEPATLTLFGLGLLGLGAARRRKVQTA